MVRHDWSREKIQFVSRTRNQLEEPSAPIELLLSVSREGAGTLGAQIEDRLRTADQVDPRVDTSSDDYSPGTRTERSDPDTVLDADDPRRTDSTGETHRA